MAISFGSSIETPGKQTLADVHDRAFKFLTALNFSFVIRPTMNANGYDEEADNEGWNLLWKVSRQKRPTVPRMQTEAAAAVKALIDWNGKGFHLAHAALMRKFPSQGEFIFHDLVPSQGPEAMLAVATFLDRVDALEKGDERKETRKEDKKAVAVLAARGIDAKERARLRGLVKQGQVAPEIPAAYASSIEAEQAIEKDQAALHAWLTEWSEVARTVVVDRADRIALGIAKKKVKSATATKPATPSPAPSPSPATAGSPA